MPDRDTTPVTVTLDRQRPYRVNDSDRQAVWVGPGEVEVPRWVAEHWGLAETQSRQQAPAKTPAVPNDAVSATVETVKEEPLKTTETVETVEKPKATSPVGRKRSGS